MDRCEECGGPLDDHGWHQSEWADCSIYDAECQLAEHEAAVTAGREVERFILDPETGAQHLVFLKVEEIPNADV